MKPIKVLQICVGGTEFGGVENFLYQYYLHINQENIHFDFLFCSQNSIKSKMNESVFRGSHFFVLNAIHSNQKNNGYKEYRMLICKLYKVLSTNSYDIVHINTGSIAIQCICLIVSEKLGIPVRIAHSHSSPPKNNFFKEILFTICRKIIVAKSTYLFACSLSAGKRLFGKNSITNENLYLIKNAIDIKKYKFSPEKRIEVRNEKHIGEDEWICCYVGRLDNNKNPFFLLDVFSELHKQISGSKLWIIGDGELKNQIQCRIRELKLYNAVTLYGIRNDVNKLLQAADIFIFPSKHEGLSISVIEAQASSLFIVASDSISKEHKLTNSIYFLSLHLNAKEWANFIIQYFQNFQRQDQTENLISSGYDISSASFKLEKLYLNVIH